jgi:hypothetical protein
MKKYSLVSIYLNSNAVKPRKKINTDTYQDNPEKAALFFMSSVFSGQNSTIKAQIKIQDVSGKVGIYDIIRKPIQKQKQRIYKHFLN